MSSTDLQSGWNERSPTSPQYQTNYASRPSPGGSSIMDASSPPLHDIQVSPASLHAPPTPVVQRRLSYVFFFFFIYIYYATLPHPAPIPAPLSVYFQLATLEKFLFIFFLNKNKKRKSMNLVTIHFGESLGFHH